MRFFFLTLFLVFTFTAFSQDYFSRIIPFEFGSPVMVQLLYEEDSYHIPIIYDDKTVVVKINEQEVEYHIIDSFTISRNGLCLFDDSEFYYFGKDRSQFKGLEILSSPLDFSSLTSHIIETEGDFNFPTVASKLSDSLFYCTFTKDFDAPDIRLPELVVFNLKTKQETRVQFNNDLTFTVPYAINSTLDGHIFISSGIRIPDVPKSYGQLIKIDRSGNIIWRNDGKEPFENGGIPTWATELSDSTIVQTYYVDRRSDMEFLANDWFELPLRLKWYNAQGDSIAEKLIITPKKQRIIYSGLKSGKGDYFFAYGGLEDWAITFGSTYYFSHLTKFSNTGDTLWTRNYQHPSYALKNIPQRIRDIYEHENGDISILANIAPVGEKNEIWLYKVDSNGCYVNEECEDMSDLVNVNEQGNDSEFNIFPNPSIGILHITMNEEVLSRVDIVDQLGNIQISLDESLVSGMQIDIHTLTAGIYFVILVEDNGAQSVKRFIKL